MSMLAIDVNTSPRLNGVIAPSNNVAVVNGQIMFNIITKQLFRRLDYSIKVAIWETFLNILLPECLSSQLHQLLFHVCFGFVRNDNIAQRVMGTDLAMPEHSRPCVKDIIRPTIIMAIYLALPAMVGYL
ncbi:hypothetical protein T09_7001 [Trichinella sp. T9]|nr:hypothetical protein T09_7001 [Trichinella sp. T9]